MVDLMRYNYDTLAEKEGSGRDVPLVSLFLNYLYEFGSVAESLPFSAPLFFPF